MSNTRGSRRLIIQTLAGITIPIGLVAALMAWPRHASADDWVRPGDPTPGPTPVSSPEAPASPDSPASPTSPSAPASGSPTLEDYWNGTATWSMETRDTGLPVGESDTVYMGNGTYWSYLHASTQSAGVVDSCGNYVEFPGCITRWVSTNGGESFNLPEPRCLMDCKACPCTEEDKTRQQQYPRVVRSQAGTWYMVFEYNGEAWITQSADGLNWVTPTGVAGSGLSDGPCIDSMKIGPHPMFTHDKKCMAGGPPGIAIVNNSYLTVFVGFGQNPGHMGCFQSPGMTINGFHRCGGSYLFAGSPTYGPTDITGGAAANPYFDFRYITSADVLRVGDYYYMLYEGVRGPSNPATRDDQFGLGFARSRIINTIWDEFPGNPIMMNVQDNWGVGHADILTVDGMTMMYTASTELTRARYILVWK